jgi:ubiquinone/menaquinone biosynthesis methyltransferase
MANTLSKGRVNATEKAAVAALPPVRRARRLPLSAPSRYDAGATMTRDIRQMFSRIARRYDRLNRLLSLGRDRRWRAWAAGLLEGKHCKRALDLCCGTGDFGIELLKRHERGRVVFADFAEPMLELARQKLSKRPEWAERSRLLAADALRLPFADAAFDAVLCAFGLRNVSSEAEALLEIKRVLKPGGTCVVLEFFRPSLWPSRLFYRTIGMTLIPLAGLVAAGSFDAYQYLTRSILDHMRIDEFIYLMETIGFRRVTGYSISAGIAGAVHGEAS